jgi:hypothetical protein
MKTFKEFAHNLFEKYVPNIEKDHMALKKYGWSDKTGPTIHPKYLNHEIKIRFGTFVHKKYKPNGEFDTIGSGKEGQLSKHLKQFHLKENYTENKPLFSQHDVVQNVWDKRKGIIISDKHEKIGGENWHLIHSHEDYDGKIFGQTKHEAHTDWEHPFGGPRKATPEEIEHTEHKPGGHIGLDCPECIQHGWTK